MSLINAGAPDCSTGLASRIYSQLIGDTTRNGFQGNGLPADWHDMVKATAYAAAKGVADEVAASSARATVDVTAGSPGSIAFVGNASNISGVSWITIASPEYPTGYRAARFTFATAMPDTDYTVVGMRESVSGDTATTRQLRVTWKATTYFDICWTATDTNVWQNLDAYTHRFSILVSR